MCVSHTFSNAPASLEEDEEKEIYYSNRGEGQFISDLCGGVFPGDQVTTVEEKRRMRRKRSTALAEERASSSQTCEREYSLGTNQLSGRRRVYSLRHQ